MLHPSEGLPTYTGTGDFDPALSRPMMRTEELASPDYASTWNYLSQTRGQAEQVIGLLQEIHRYAVDRTDNPVLGTFTSQVCETAPEASELPSYDRYQMTLSYALLGVATEKGLRVAVYDERSGLTRYQEMDPVVREVSKPRAALNGLKRLLGLEADESFVQPLIVPRPAKPDFYLVLASEGSAAIGDKLHHAIRIASAKETAAMDEVRRAYR